ncbi:hypothetical protein HU200_004965 [Digitaria exilis]|uniref:Uncharacterized protein n=1 Tax=Digitaria exilis TaxID=1010633 RepID=A0A835FU34_9POAL|nr:hypothetical protein HU200_004965 [Digitaria exilis]
MHLYLDSILIDVEWRTVQIFLAMVDNTTNSVDVYETPRKLQPSRVTWTTRSHQPGTPDGRVLATGNQDTTCRLWDIRNLSQSFAVLKGRIAPSGTFKFSSDGRFLAASEVADSSTSTTCTPTTLRSRRSTSLGRSPHVVHPDDEALFVGVSDRMIGSLMEFRRRRRHDYLESFV